jgi:predicted metal-dependent hydrolase
MLFDYRVIRSSRKTIAIQVTIDGMIIVRAPLKMSDAAIEKFVIEKKSWLERAIVSQRNKAKNKKIYSQDDIERLRKRAKEVIPIKVDYFSRLMGVKPKSVKITSAKTRFGSCSSQNSLNFSLYLMDKDERFIDYVVVHELAHIKHHNHSKQFYEFVGCFIPDYKEIEKLK